MQRTSGTIREIIARLETKIDTLESSIQELKSVHRDAVSRVNQIERKVYVFAGVLMGLELSLKVFWHN